MSHIHVHFSTGTVPPDDDPSLPDQELEVPSLELGYGGTLPFRVPLDLGRAGGCGLKCQKGPGIALL